MSATPSAQKWLSSLEASQQVYSGHKLNKTLSYLRGARKLGEGWGHYPGMKSDLYHSAIVIQALSNAADEAYLVAAADAAAYLRSEKKATAGVMKMEDVCYLLTITRAEQRPDDDEFLDCLLGHLRHSYEERMRNKEPVTTRLLCDALLALLPLSRGKSDLIDAWSEKLLDLQLVDGSWPAVADGDGTVVTTAMAVRATKYVPGEKACDALGRGVNFLQRQLEEKGWKGLGGGDIFTQSMVLWALAEVPRAEYGFIEEGIETLKGEMNQDGSWGNSPGEVGNVENTALSLLALVAAGENSFVPARLSKAALADLQHQLALITEERNALRQDFEKRVRDECGVVRRERDTLLKENKALKGTVQAGEKELQKAMEAKESAELRLTVARQELAYMRISSFEVKDRNHDAYRKKESLGFEESLPSRLFDSLSFNLFLRVSLALGPTLGAAALIYYFWASPISVLKILLFILTGVVGVGLSLFAWLMTTPTLSLSKDLYRDLIDDFTYPSSEISSLRRSYSSIIETLPPDVREELAYRLLKEIAEMPPDVGVRYIDDLLYRLDLPSPVRGQLTTWVRVALRLSPSERRVLFTSLTHGG